MRHDHDAQSTAPVSELPALPPRGYGDGYDWMGEVESPWHVIAGWGRDGWDMGDWPYVQALKAVHVIAPEDRLPRREPPCIWCHEPLRQVVDVPKPRPRGVRTELTTSWVVGQDGRGCPATGEVHRPQMRTKVYGVATYVEGDIDRWAFETYDEMIAKLDEIAQWYWRREDDPRGFPHMVPIGPLPARYFGPFSWKRVESEKDSGPESTP